MKKLLIIFILGISGMAQAGLDITAYSNLVEVKSPQLTKEGGLKNPNEVRFYAGDFPEQFKGLKENQVYRFKQQFDFRAGSYSGYNWWRNELAKLAGNPPTEDKETGELRYDLTVWENNSGAFSELINFSDAEGTIGYKSCQRTYQDFLKFQDKALQHESEDFKESYQDWKKAFAICSQHGAIEFH